VVGSTVQGCQCFFLGEPYIRQYPSPLAIYPLRTALGNIVHLLIALAVILTLVWTLKGFDNLAMLWVLLPTLLMIFVFAWSLAVLSGAATVYFQDTQHICEVGFQMLFYATPIIYKVGMLRETGLEWLFSYNPIVPFLDLLRIPILEAQVPGVGVFSAAFLITVAVASPAGLTLTRLQQRLIFHL
jgi:ABC-type polysaccharide/polyol phosphate export permease